MPLVIATSNAGKLDELRMLLPTGLRLRTAREVGVSLPEETGTTYLENARLKAQSVACSGYVALADDSGLEVDALDGQPGVRSARYAGAGATDEENNALLLSRLRHVPTPERSARFVSVVVLALPDRTEYRGIGLVEGRIALAPRGSHGFGYDPLFEFADPQLACFNGRTAAELSTTTKNQLSHRARAIHDLLARLDSLGLSLSTMTGD